jgi:cellulose 1,4-beta-cellobiosidase
MYWQFVIALSSLRLAVGQGVGTYQNEIHPKLQWNACTVDGDCENVHGELVMDANLRWLHTEDGTNCYMGNIWNHDVCNTTQSCTDICVVDGAS